MATATTAKTTINVNVLGVMLLVVTSNLPFLIFNGAMDPGSVNFHVRRPLLR
jgi:hypothetical protein